MQRTLKVHVKKRLENLAELEFCWERAVDELMKLGKRNSEVLSMIENAVGHPCYE
jgi:hypothetical protein